MKKKVIFIPVFLVISLIFVFFFFSSVSIDGVSYNKRKIDNLIEERNDQYRKLDISFSSEINEIFGDYFNTMFFDVINNESNIIPAVKNNSFITSSRNAIDSYYNKAREIDAHFLNQLINCKAIIPYTYKSKKYNTFDDIFPSKINIYECGNILYNEIYFNFIISSIEKLHKDFEDLINFNTNAIIENIKNNYALAVSEEFLNADKNIYSNELSVYLEKISKLTEQSLDCFDFLLTACRATDTSEINSNIIIKQLPLFSPLGFKVYNNNGNYYHSNSLDAFLDYFLFLVNNWNKHNEAFLNIYISKYINTINYYLSGTSQRPNLLSLAETAEYEYYKEMLNGNFFNYYINQCTVSVISNSTDISGTIVLDYKSMIPFSLIEIDGIIYDNLAISALMHSMPVISENIVDKTKILFIDAVNSQTEIYLNNIEEYVNWYFSLGTGINRIINTVIDTVKGDKSSEEKYIIDNFNTIMNKNSGFYQIIGKNLEHYTDTIYYVFNQYLEIINFFQLAQNKEAVLSFISKNDFISPYSSGILSYYDQVGESLNSMDAFFIQDYTINITENKSLSKLSLGLLSDENFIGSLIKDYQDLKSQDSTNRTELKEKMAKSLMEIQQRKIQAINDPFNFIYESIKTGTVLYVENYFAGFSAYQHYGVYIGSGKVIHYAPYEGQEISFENGVIHETTVEKFLNGRALRYIKNIQPAFPEDEIIRRARSRIGEKQYNLITNNCEHFARWCVTGENISYQVVNAPRLINETRLTIEENYNTVKKFLELFN
ncbi:MAG: lecithin retinol acyltransferase family protein [Treponema sp.]|nr:lecithin retinol acyltransferase family protein [Treponema sp.]